MCGLYVIVNNVSCACWYGFVKIPVLTRMFLTKMVRVSNDLAATREKRSSGFPTRSDTNRTVQSQLQARSLKFRI